jgi:AcrR family transcriptional regulator
MGRPKLHDEHTAAALLDAAERIVEADGPDALSLRRLGEQTRTATRAVYSVYGSKDGLVAALAARGFDILRDGVAQVPTTPQPDRDLIEAGLVFRRYAVDHPSLFRIAFQNQPSGLRTMPAVRDAVTDALDVLKRRIARLDDAGLLGDCSVDEATLHFHAVCEGLAALELRGTLSSDPKRLWRQGLGTLVHGLAQQGRGTPTRPKRPKPASTSAQ